MTEISEAAMARARELVNVNNGAAFNQECVADYIQQVSDAAKAVGHISALDETGKRHELLAPFILSDPVDPLLIEAREICARVCEDIEDANGLKASASYWREKYLSGDCDRNKDVQFALAALKRGMELAK